MIEAVAAWGAGRLTVADMETLARAFLGSDRVVRLVNGDSTGRAPASGPPWRTAASKTESLTIWPFWNSIRRSRWSRRR